MYRTYCGIGEKIYTIEVEKGYKGEIFASVDKQTRENWRESLVGHNIIWEKEYKGEINAKEIIKDLRKSELKEKALVLEDWLSIVLVGVK